MASINMTRLAILLAGLCALAAASSNRQLDYKVASKEILERQRDVLRLYQYIDQPSYYKDLDQIAQQFRFEGAYDQWTRPEYAQEFFNYYQKNILPQGEIFSPFYPEQLQQAIALFRVFYYAKDYDTFYRAAAWARQNVNEGMYVYALSVAIINSKLTADLVLPPIYEICPQYFFNDEVIYKARLYKQHYWGNYKGEQNIKDANYRGYTIQANYSGWYLNLHPEQSLSYFTEDVGLNSYYFYVNIFSPSWLNENEFRANSERRGEFFYYYNQQLLARYYLERLSNGQGEIPHYEYEYPIETGYYPSLTYYNGLKFPSRPNHADLYYSAVHGRQSYRSYGNYSYSYRYVKDYERRIRDTIDWGYIKISDSVMYDLYEDARKGFEIIGNLVQGNPKSPNRRFFGDLQTVSRRLLGYSYFPLDPYKAAPSALEQYETSLRDPAFYQLYKRILSYFVQYQNYVGPYKRENLLLDGVKIDDLQTDRLITYFDYFYSDLANAISVNEQEFASDSFQVRARQYRLNHKPFSYKISLASNRDQEVIVKVFIGPKYDEYGRDIRIEDNYLNFFLLDRFKYQLQSGKNTIDRKSKESIYFSNDRTTYKQLYQQVLTAINGGEDYRIYSNARYYAFPERLMLPKGEFGGKTYQLYILVSKYDQSLEGDRSNEYVDNQYSLGYPFDRPIENGNEFFVPNSIIKNIVIYHRQTEDDINTTWSNY